MISAAHPLTPSCVLFLFLCSGSGSGSPSGCKRHQAIRVQWQWRAGNLRWRNADNAGVTPAAFDRLWAPLSYHGGHSSTQHPHAALWSPLSSSTENNFPSASKKRKKTRNDLHHVCSVLLVSLLISNCWNQAAKIQTCHNRVCLTHYGLIWHRSCFIVLCTLPLRFLIMLCASALWFNYFRCHRFLVFHFILFLCMLVNICMFYKW